MNHWAHSILKLRQEMQVELKAIQRRVGITFTAGPYRTGQLKADHRLPVSEFPIRGTGSINLRPWVVPLGD